MDDEAHSERADIFDRIVKSVAENGIDVTDLMRDQDGVLRGIGRVAIASAHMERVAQSLLLALVGGGRAELLIVGQNFATTYQGIKAVLKDSPDTDELREAGRLIEQANRLYEQRSHVVHGDWVIVVSREWQGNVAQQYRRHGRIVNSRWTSETLEVLADQVEQTSIAMMELTRQMGFASPGPLPLFDTDQLRQSGVDGDQIDLGERSD